MDNFQPTLFPQDNRLEDGPHEYEFMEDKDLPNSSVPSPTVDEYQMIPDDFSAPPPPINMVAPDEYQTIPDDFSAPPPSKQKSSDIYAYDDPSDILTNTQRPESAYETPVDAKIKARTIASPIQYPPVITEYETPIDAMKTL